MILKHLFALSFPSPVPRLNFYMISNSTYNVPPLNSLHISALIHTYYYLFLHIKKKQKQ